MVAISRSNPIYGAQGFPQYITGAWYTPQGYAPNGNALTTTINRCYYVPFAIVAARTFQGASVVNQGTGDNGEKIRLMVFNDNGAAGGPGTLAKDFGEITLTGASAVRTLSSSWAATPGIYWSAVWHKTAADMYSMENYHIATAVGAINANVAGDMIGDLGWTGGIRTVQAHYVDTAYGAAPSTAVAPTASVINAGVTTGAVTPAFALKA